MIERNQAIQLQYLREGLFATSKPISPGQAVNGCDRRLYYEHQGDPGDLARRKREMIKQSARGGIAESVARSYGLKAWDFRNNDLLLGGRIYLDGESDETLLVLVKPVSSSIFGQIKKSVEAGVTQPLHFHRDEAYLLMHVLADTETQISPAGEGKWAPGGFEITRASVIYIRENGKNGGEESETCVTGLAPDIAQSALLRMEFIRKILSDGGVPDLVIDSEKEMMLCGSCPYQASCYRKEGKGKSATYHDLLAQPQLPIFEIQNGFDPTELEVVAYKAKMSVSCGECGENLTVYHRKNGGEWCFSVTCGCGRPDSYWNDQLNNGTKPEEVIDFQSVAILP